MEKVTAVGKRTTFFLLLVLAASASVTSLKTKQQNTAIDRQVRSVDVCTSLCLSVDALNPCWALTIHTTQPHSLILQKKAIPSFPLKACTSSNAGEMWKAEGGADSIWVCQNNKWIPYE